MTWRTNFHQRVVHARRIRILADRVGGLVGNAKSLLDIGAGDGWLGAEVRARCPGVHVSGIDIQVRPRTHIPIEPFDGLHIPLPDQSVDLAMLVDVLHHTQAPARLLGEAVRVARCGVILKDHLCNSSWDHLVLSFMDQMGNRQFGVPIPCNYLSIEAWQLMFKDLGIQPRSWEEHLHLYAQPADWLFGRGLHFLAHLVRG